MRSPSFGLKCRPGLGGGTLHRPAPPEPHVLALHWARPNPGTLSQGPHGAAISLPLFEDPVHVWAFFFFFRGHGLVNLVTCASLAMKREAT